MKRVYLMSKIILITILLVLFTRETSWQYIGLFMLISLIAVTIFTLTSLYLLGKYYLWQYKRGKKMDKEKIFGIVQKYIRLVNHLFRIDTKITGYENYDPSHNYLITPNHQSNQDILIMIDIMKDPILFVSKFSMSRVIMVKDWMFLLGCLYLKKDDLRDQMKVLKNVVTKLNDGHNVVLYPEGRRSYESKMNEFKSGAFKMGLRSQHPILPITLNHVHKFKHNFPFRKTTITVHIHKPIFYETYHHLKTNEISDLVKETIQSKIVE